MDSLSHLTTLELATELHKRLKADHQTEQNEDVRELECCYCRADGIVSQLRWAKENDIGHSSRG